MEKKKKELVNNNVYQVTKFCSQCDSKMIYRYGEVYECPVCGNKELSDFGKVKQFLNDNGPQPAIIINQATGVSIDYINKLLRQGRIEIPDGSDVYIRCQKCGTDIRYGRFCPDCMSKMTKEIGKIMWMPEVGEKPHNSSQTGKMHTLGSLKDKRVTKNSKENKKNK